MESKLSRCIALCALAILSAGHLSDCEVQKVKDSVEDDRLSEVHLSIQLWISSCLLFISGS